MMATSNSASASVSVSAAASDMPVKITLGPYPNRLQCRDTTATAAAALAAATAADPELRSPLLCSSEPTSTLTAGRSGSSSFAEDRARTSTAVADSARTKRAVAVIRDSGFPLAEAPAPLRDMFQAACDGDVRMLQANLRLAHADINAIGQPSPNSYKGNTFEKRWTFAAPPIVFAAAFNREKAVAALIAWGADVTVKSSTGMTAKEYAQRRGYTSVVGRLEAAEQQQQQQQQ